ncbi:suppressor APC domain-containing protein 2-like [Scyliorhinus canicula]|uniref:suppressor APC domain-containing protein 2-like n=1 Tax=Scyliorhinus canicula TaxID=7830 RepID=UPI0018F39DB1|nr:suppressor APC domain-containing protein 2-like [Scyliorhinus canicula]
MPLQAGYTLVIIPLHSSLEAGRYFVWLKQMKKLEQQRDALWHGLEMVERARDWYHQEIQGIHQRLRHGGESLGDNDSAPRSLPSRVSLLQDKIQHVNYRLCDFISSAERVLLPHHYTEQPDAEHLSRGKDRRLQQRTLDALKQQNYLLTKEVSRRSQWITQLEQEKSVLIKQLLEAQFESHTQSSWNSSIFV